MSGGETGVSSVTVSRFHGLQADDGELLTVDPPNANAALRSSLCSSLSSSPSSFTVTAAINTRGSDNTDHSRRTWTCLCCLQMFPLVIYGGEQLDLRPACRYKVNMGASVQSGRVKNCIKSEPELGEVWHYRGAFLRRWCLTLIPLKLRRRLPQEPTSCCNDDTKTSLKRLLDPFQSKNQTVLLRKWLMLLGFKQEVKEKCDTFSHPAASPRTEVDARGCSCLSWYKKLIVLGSKSIKGRTSLTEQELKLSMFVTIRSETR